MKTDVDMLIESESYDLQVFIRRCRIFAWTNLIAGVLTFLGTTIQMVNKDIYVLSGKGLPFQIALLQLILMAWMSGLVFAAAKKGDAFVWKPTNEFLQPFFRKLVFVFLLFTVELMVLVYFMLEFILDL
ncbi:MAG: hypothetical protein KG003_16245 [Bacteroidetes bacterium]|nr:hypothetical protein [Bacteroidota bacterium]